MLQQSSAGATHVGSTEVKQGGYESCNLDVIQALSSSAATASTLHHLPANNGTPPGSTLDSRSVSRSEADGLNNVPPPPPPLGIERKFEMLSMSDSKYFSSQNNNEGMQSSTFDQQQHQTSTRRTLFQKLNSLGLVHTSNQTRKNTNNNGPAIDSNISDQNVDSANTSSNNNIEASSSHFSTLRRLYSHRRRRTASVGSSNSDVSVDVSEQPGGTHFDVLNSTCQNRQSTSSILFPSMPVSGSDVEEEDDYKIRNSKATRSESMSSLASRGSTLSWFRKRSSRIRNRGELIHFF